MKFSLINNPFTWVLLFILLVLGCNVATKKAFVNRLPDNIVVEPKTQSKDYTGYDSIKVIATDFYNAGGWKRLWQGKGYRDAWAATVSVPVVMLDTIHGGIKPVKKGGGNQTRSMDLQDSSGVYYTIRSVTKNPINLIPNWMWALGIENIVTDGISAGHPYGALVIPPLADAVGVLHTHPRLVYIPFQNALDTFNTLFGNRLYIMEYEPQGEMADWTGLENVKEIIDSDDVREHINKNPSLKINHRALVRARLLDIVIGDWDRHSKQWEWAVIENNGDTTFHPIPTDRDNVFYGISGVIPWIVSRPFIEKRLRPFKKDVDHFKGLVDNAKYFDSFYLLDVPKEMFLEEAQKMQAALTDEVIENAIKQWPKVLYDLNGEEIIVKIKARRDKLPKYAEKFYTVIQKRGFVPLPDEPEIKHDLKK